MAKQYSEDQLRNLKVDVKRLPEWRKELLKIEETFIDLSLQRYRHAALTIIEASKNSPPKLRSELKRSIEMIRTHQDLVREVSTESSDRETWLAELDLKKLLYSSQDIKAPNFARWGINIDPHKLLQDDIDYVSDQINSINLKGTTDSIFGEIFLGKRTSKDLNNLKDSRESYIRYRIHADLLNSEIIFVNDVYKRSRKALMRISEIKERIDLAEKKLSAIERFEAKHGKAFAKAAAVDLQTRNRASSIKRLIRKTANCPYCDKSLGINPHLDHIYPVSKGGLSITENLVWCCAQCNASKSDNGLVSFLQENGLDVSSAIARLTSMGKHV